MLDRIKRFFGREVPKGDEILLILLVSLSAAFGVLAAIRYTRDDQGLWAWVSNFALYGFLAWAALAILGLVAVLIATAVTDDLKGSIKAVLVTTLYVGCFGVAIWLLDRTRPEVPPLTPRQKAEAEFLGRLPSVDHLGDPEDYRSPKSLSVETKRWLIANHGWTKADFDALDTLAEYAGGFDPESPTQDIAEGYVRGLETTLLFDRDLKRALEVIRSIPAELLQKMGDALQKRALEEHRTPDVEGGPR